MINFLTAFYADFPLVVNGLVCVTLVALLWQFSHRFPGITTPGSIAIAALALHSFIVMITQVRIDEDDVLRLAAIVEKDPERLKPVLAIYIHEHGLPADALEWRLSDYMGARKELEKPERNQRVQEAKNLIRELHNANQNELTMQ